MLCLVIFDDHYTESALLSRIEENYNQFNYTRLNTEMKGFKVWPASVNKLKGQCIVRDNHFIISKLS